MQLIIRIGRRPYVSASWPHHSEDTNLPNIIDEAIKPE